MSDEPHDLHSAIAQMEHVQNDLRSIAMHPEHYESPSDKLAPILALITALRGRTSRWLRPTDDERRAHERRQNERRSHQRRWLWA